MSGLPRDFVIGNTLHTAEFAEAAQRKARLKHVGEVVLLAFSLTVVSALGLWGCAEYIDYRDAKYGLDHTGSPQDGTMSIDGIGAFEMPTETDTVDAFSGN